MSYDPENPLARMEGETRKANDALHDYYGLGRARSFAKLEKKYKESGVRTREKTIAVWSSKYKWQERVDKQAAIDNEAEREFWAQARRDIREADYKAAIELRERAARMRAFPIAETKTIETYDDGREKTVIIQPANWREADVSRIETAASDLARRAADMQKEKVAIDIEVTEIDFSSLTDQQLKRIMAGESIKAVIGTG